MYNTLEEESNIKLKATQHIIFFFSKLLYSFHGFNLFYK